MKITKQIVVALILLTAVSALYRVVPGRPWGFAPQIAMAIFGGALFSKNKEWAFVLPLLSMFISDVLYEVLYNAGLSTMAGFYEGQWQNYLLFALLTSIGFLVKKIKVLNVLLASIAAPSVYFVLSNLLVWASGGGYNRPKTWDGLLMSYADGLPFYQNSIYATIFFAGVLFGSYFLIQKSWAGNTNQLA